LKGGIKRKKTLRINRARVSPTGMIILKEADRTESLASSFEISGFVMVKLSLHGSAGNGSATSSTVTSV
jgi:hypothetical protein